MKRRGLVEIREEMGRDVPLPRFSASWQLDPDSEEAAIIEDAFEELEGAIAWARARGSQVFVDLEDEPWQYVRYSLNDVPSLERWSGELPPEPARVAEYGGDVYVHDEAMWEQRGFLAVHWVGSEEIDRKNHSHDLEAAIDWGRSRADVVTVEVFPSSFSAPPPPRATRYSVGDRDPAGESLLRLRPRPGELTMRWQATFPDGTQIEVDAPTLAEAEIAVAMRYADEVLKPDDETYMVLGGFDVKPLDAPH